MIASRFAREATLNEREPLSTTRADCTVTGGASSGRRSLAVAALVLVSLLLPLLRGFDKPAARMDEGSLLVYPELILKGNLPYRDFETFYGPANIYVLAGVYVVFGPSILAERATGLVYRLLILGAVFCIARRWGSALAAGATLIAGAVFLDVGVVAYAWMGGIACALWSIFIISKTDSCVRSFFGGMLVATALLFRPDLGPGVILSSLPLFLLMHRRAQGRYIAGIVVALLPLACLVVFVGMRPVLDNFFVYPVFHTSAGRRLPLFGAETYVIYLFFAHLVASLINVAAGAYAVRVSRRDPRARLLLAAALLGLGLTHQAAQRIDDAHVIFASFASLGLLPLSLFVLLSAERCALPIRSREWIAVATALVAIETFIPELAVNLRSDVGAALTPNAQTSFYLEKGNRAFPFNSMGPVRATGKIFERIDTLALPGDRLFVGPADLRRTNYNDTFLYHMLPQLRPATYFLEMNPGSANRPNSRLASDIRTADWLILNRLYDTWIEPNSSSTNGPDAPNAVVRTEFTLCDEFGAYLLFRRKSPRG